MSRLLLLATFTALLGCATSQRGPKMSFAEAFRDRGAPPPEAEVAKVKPARVKAPAPKPQAGPPVATESLELGAALSRFAHLSRQQRSRSPRGSRMPLVQQENWDRFLDTLARFLERPAARTSSRDVIRARVAAEAELEMDARRYGDVPPELAQRVLDQVTMLAVRMNQVRRLQVKTAPARATFDWPIEPVIVTSLFGRRLHPIKGTWKAHYGVDLDAYNGQLVSAAGKGTVVSAGWNGAHGKQVELRHPGGVITRYSHLSSTLVVPGAIVDRGDPVGLAGSTGLATGSHLHFEVWREGRPVDPLDALADQPTREVLAGAPRS